MSTTKELTYLPEFFDRYIKLVDPEMALLDCLKKYKSLYRDQLTQLSILGDKVYAPGKWTAKQIIQHIIDNERIMSTRLMRLARNEGIDLPGYEQDVLALNAKVGHRTIENIIKEFELCRMSTISLVENLTDIELSLEGKCSGIKLQAYHLGFQMPGHQIHHQNVLEEKYYHHFNV